MVGEIDEERSAALPFDERQRLVGEPVGELVAVGVEVGVFRKAEALRKHDRVEALAAGRDRSGAAAAEVPHAEERGRIAAGLQSLGQGDDLGRELRPALRSLEFVPGRTGRLPRIDDGVDAMPGRGLPRHQAGPRRRAVGGRCIGLREHEAPLRQPVEVRRVHERVAHEADIPPAHVVHQDEHHVRRPARLGRCCRHRGQRQREHDSREDRPGVAGGHGAARS